MKNFSIIWDDGLVSDLKIIEYLNKENLKSTFSLSPNVYKNTRTQNDSRNKSYGERIAKAEIIEFSNFEILNHTTNHVDLTNCDISTTKEEIETGQKMLEDIFQRNIKGFCYPYGATNKFCEKILKQNHNFARTTQINKKIQIKNKFLIPTTCKWTKFNYNECEELNIIWGHSYEIKEFDQVIELYQKICEIGKIIDLEDLITKFNMKKYL